MADFSIANVISVLGVLGVTVASITALFVYVGKTLIESIVKRNLDKIAEKNKHELNMLLETHRYDLDKMQVDYVRSIKKQETLESTLIKYSGVILLSAVDLQDRLWHLCERQSQARNPILKLQDENQVAYDTWPMTKSHYLHSTLFLMSRYFCWIEILRSDIQFLNFGNSDKTNRFNHFIKKVERSLAETELQKLSLNSVSSDRPIFQLMQSQMGESLIINIDGHKSCMMYNSFLKEVDGFLSTSSGFIAAHDLMIGAMGNYKSKFHLTRLKLMNNALVDLIYFLNENSPLAVTDGIEKVSIKNFNLDEYNQILK